MRFVLVPGGWQGGWAYDDVAAELRRDGHGVQAVTLAGLEPDGPDDPDRPANLDAHIDQVVKVVAASDVAADDGADDGPLVLCGHSYAGLVIAGVADRLAGRLDHLVFVDAYVPDDGDSCWSLTSDAFRQMFVEGARADGRWVAVPEGLDPRARPHPLPSLLQSLNLAGDPAPGYRRTYVSGGAWPGSPFGELTARLRDDPDWQVHEVPVGHNVARRDPHALAALLAALPGPGG